MKRRVAIPLIVLALLAAALYVALRGTDDGAAPVAGDAARDASAEPTHRPPRARVPEPAPLPPRAIRVAVTSMDGTPIPRALVKLLRGPDVETWSNQDPHQVLPRAEAPPPDAGTFAADDGIAQFDDVPAGRWWVAANAPGFGIHVVGGIVTRADGSGVDAVAALERGHAVWGRVFDPAGRSSAGVEMILVPSRTYPYWFSDALCLRTTTDEEGCYRFGAVPPGECTLYYCPTPDVVVPALRFRSNAFGQLDVHEVAGAVITGTVRDADTGEPVRAATVCACARSERDSNHPIGAVRCDLQGRFELRTWRTECEVATLRVDDPRYASVPADDAGELWFAGTKDMSDGQRFAVELRVHRGATLRGTLRGTDGPLAGVGMSLPAGEGVTADIVTDANGAFVFERMPPGPVDDVEIRTRTASERYGWPEGMTLVAGGVTVQDMTAQVRRGRAAGRVVDAERRPVAGADVCQVGDEGGARVRTDADGRFALDVLFVSDGAGLCARAAGFEPVLFGVALGSAPTEDVEIYPLKAWPGVVRDANGAPVAAARVAVELPESRWHDAYSVYWSDQSETVTGSDGSFTFLRAEAPGVFAFSPVDSATRGRARDGADVTLPALRRVTGRVVAAGTGEPIAFVDVAGEGAVLARTTEDGRFDVDYEPGEKHQLWCGREGRLWTSVKDDAIGSGELRVEMSVALAIAGLVREADGAPVTGIRVEVESTERDGDTPRWSGHAATDSDGRFVVRDLGAGGYVVRAEDVYHQRFEPAETTSPAGAARVVIVLKKKP